MPASFLWGTYSARWDAIWEILKRHLKPPGTWIIISYIDSTFVAFWYILHALYRGFLMPRLEQWIPGKTDSVTEMMHLTIQALFTTGILVALLRRAYKEHVNVIWQQAAKEILDAKKASATKADPNPGEPSLLRELKHRLIWAVVILVNFIFLFLWLQQHLVVRRILIPWLQKQFSWQPNVIDISATFILEHTLDLTLLIVIAIHFYKHIRII